MRSVRFRVLLLVAVAFLVLPGWLRAGGVEARQRGVDVPLDLAAVAPRPSDPMLGDFVLNGGRIITLQEIAVTYGESVEDLRAAGYGRQYLHNLTLPPAGDSACVGQVISTWVYEYTDEEFAAGGARDSARIMRGDGVAQIDDNLRIGDGGVLFDEPMADCGSLADEEQGIRSLRQESADECGQPKLGKVEACAGGTTSAVGGEFEGLHAIFQVGRFEIHVWLFNNSNPDVVPANALAVTRDTIEQLGATVVDHADDVLAREPGELMEPMIVRIGDDEHPFPTSSDGYIRYDSEDFTLIEDEGDAKEARAGRFGDAIDVYGMTQQYELANGDDANYRVTLYRFEDEAAASDWLAGAYDRLLADQFYEDLTEIGDVPALGDETYAATMLNTRADMQDMRIYVRVGAFVAVMGFASNGDLAPLDVAAEAAAIQADCLDAGFCDGTIPAPEW